MPSAATTQSTPTNALVDERERRIVPARRRFRLRDLPGTGPVVRVLVGRDFKVKYKQSVLGPLWLVFQPAALLLAFLVAFKGLGHAQNGHVPYVLFALSGLAVWSFFQAAMTIGAAAMISNTNLVKSTPCPRIAPLISAVGSSLPSLAITAGAALAGSLADGEVSARLLLLPIGVAWLFCLTLGVVAIFASLAVRYRDVVTALPFVLQLGAFIAPVGYSLHALSGTLRVVVEINPITGLVEAFRWMLLGRYAWDPLPIAISLAMTVAVAVAGWRFFTLREPTMADVI